MPPYEEKEKETGFGECSKLAGVLAFLCILSLKSLIFVTDFLARKYSKRQMSAPQDLFIFVIIYQSVNVSNSSSLLKNNSVCPAVESLSLISITFYKC